jgi:eukaryotic-like serine/threonine-protein kinase
VFSEDVADDHVVSLAEGTKRRLEKGETVGLVVSKGPEPRTIPAGLAGKGEDEVVGALAFLKLTPRVERDFDDEVPAGTVIRTDPAGGASVPRGAEVIVTVSRGPELATVPDVTRTDNLDDATELLESRGFEVEVQGPVRGRPVRTDPAAGEEVRKGSTVTLILRARGDD